MVDGNGCTDTYDTTILVVEDSEAIRRVICAILVQNGYRCREASNGAEALNMLRADATVRMVLSDIVMPKMGGAELGACLAREFPHLPIVFMSGYSDNPSVQAIQGTPIFLSKPFTASALTDSVRRALKEPWRGLQEWYLGVRPQ